MYKQPETLPELSKSKQAQEIIALPPETFFKDADTGMVYLTFKKESYKKLDKDYKGTLENGDKSIVANIDRQTTLQRVFLIG